MTPPDAAPEPPDLAPDLARPCVCGHPIEWHEADPDTGEGSECGPPDLSYCPCIEYEQVQ